MTFILVLIVGVRDLGAEVGDRAGLLTRLWTAKIPGPAVTVATLGSLAVLLNSLRGHHTHLVPPIFPQT